jgi:hypothetical protein
MDSENVLREHVVQAKLQSNNKLWQLSILEEWVHRCGSVVGPII